MNSRAARKTLIVSSWAPPAIGGPQNMYNIFSQFPSDSYCLLTSYYGIDNYSARHGTWLNGKYIFYDNPGFLDTPAHRPEVSAMSTGRERIKRLRLAVKKSGVLKVLLGPFLIFSQIVMIVRAGRKAVKDEEVEVLLGISDFGPAMISTYILHKLTGKPYLLHLYDIYAGNFYPWPGGPLARFFEKRLFRHAERIIVTNEGTRDFYEKRYGRDLAEISVIHNAVFPDKYLALQTPYAPKEPYIIVFTGRIYWPQIESLKNLVRAVGEIKDMKIKLKFYVPQPREYVRSLGFDAEKIELASAPPEEMPEIQSRADILFLPLSWGTKSPQIVETATPGKLSDYLISGRPILIHAPVWTTLARYAKADGFALVVDEDNVLKLKEAVMRLLTDRELGQRLVRNARATFERGYDARQCAAAMMKFLQKS